MNRTDVLTIVLAPMTRQHRPMRLSRINDALTAAGHTPTTFDELTALLRMSAGRPVDRHVAQVPAEAPS